MYLEKHSAVSYIISYIHLLKVLQRRTTSVNFFSKSLITLATVQPNKKTIKSVENVLSREILICKNTWYVPLQDETNFKIYVH